MMPKVPWKSLPAVLSLLVLIGCSQNGESVDHLYESPPILQYSQVLDDDGGQLKPVKISYRSDTIYVVYAGRAQIDMFTPELARIGRIALDDPEPIFPTDFVVADSEIFVCDHARGIIVVYDRSGRFLESYGTLPDNITRLRPFALAYYGGVLYVGDAGQRKVLAISMAEASGITERGELILAFPHDDNHALSFLSALLVMPDGRMLIGDAGQGDIRVFTCDGRYVYRFDSLPSPSVMAPQGFALDNVIDPSLQDSTSFDPSGLRAIGRIHAVDINAGKIHMFNPLGKYVGSYPEKELLKKPSDIAIDKMRRCVYVAESETGNILVYRYGD